MPSVKSKEKLIVGILHNHSGELSTTIGVIEVDSVEQEDKTAEGHIEFWLAAKKRQHRCKRYGDGCSVSVRSATPSMKTAMLLASAEPIVPPRAAKKTALTAQKGFSFTELLIVVAIIGVIAAIAIPSVIRAGIAARQRSFKDSFGIVLPITFETRHAPLSEDAKRLLRPYVQMRLNEICSAPNVTETYDSVEIERRLGDMVDHSRKCVNARAVAQREGILPAEVP